MKMKKSPWLFVWDDLPRQSRPMSRSRVAELLYAARSRRAQVKRIPGGYVIGQSLQLVRNPAPTAREGEAVA